MSEKMSDQKSMYDQEWMRRALALARKAAEKGEVPVGAVIVKNDTNEMVSQGYNLRENNRMATAHAELIAIEEACRSLGGWRLLDCTLYVTLEPCPMCAGALINSRISRVVYGTKDPLGGCLGSVIDFNSYPFNHSFSVTYGVCEEECKTLLNDFFASRRKEK